MARPGDVVRALGRGPALGRAAAGAGATIGQALMAHGARRQREEEQLRQEGQTAARAAGYALVPESYVQALGIEGAEPIQLEGFDRPRYLIKAPGEMFDPETDIQILREKYKQENKLGPYRPDVPDAGFDPATDIPTQRELYKRENMLGVYRPDTDEENDGGELGPGTTNWAALRAEIKSSAAGKVAEEVGRLGDARGLSSNTEAVQRIWEKLRADYGNVEGRALQAIWREAIREAEQEATKTKTSGAAADLINRYRQPQP